MAERLWPAQVPEARKPLRQFLADQEHRALPPKALPMPLLTYLPVDEVSGDKKAQA